MWKQKKNFFIVLNYWFYWNRIRISTIHEVKFCSTSDIFHMNSIHTHTGGFGFWSSFEENSRLDEYHTVLVIRGSSVFIVIINSTNKMTVIEIICIRIEISIRRRGTIHTECFLFRQLMISFLWVLFAYLKNKFAIPIYVIII
jgi:hypothetical protein